MSGESLRDEKARNATELKALEPVLYDKDEDVRVLLRQFGTLFIIANGFAFGVVFLAFIVDSVFIYFHVITSNERVFTPSGLIVLMSATAAEISAIIIVIIRDRRK